MLAINWTNVARGWWLPLLALNITGCGLTQHISDGSKSVFNAVFYQSVKVLHLDFTAREALNTDTKENQAFSVPVVLRIYQLTDRQQFDQLSYEALLKNGDSLLKNDRLTQQDRVLKPGGDVSLDMPMETETRFVAVVGLFRDPDQNQQRWKLVMLRSDLDPNLPRIVEVANNTLTLLPR